MSDSYSNAFNTIENLSARLTQLDKLKDDFLAKTSHELKTPLNGIINITQSLLDGSAGDLNEEQYEDLQLITNVGKRLSNLVYDILDYSKLKNMDITLHLTTLDIYPVIDSTLDIFRYLIKGKLIEFDNQVPENTYYISADENRFRQIIFNLLDNAVKFTMQGKITISASLIKDEVSIAIKDTGIGIPKSMQESIFQSYEQLEQDQNTSNGGVGLGLSITKQLVGLHKGTISVDSEYGKGSCFTVTFAANGKEEFVAIEDYVPKESKQSMTKYHLPYEYHLPYSKHVHGKSNILVVDDEYSNLKSLLSTLTLWEYNVTITDNPETAMLLIEHACYDLLILDIMMPIMSGFEMCRKVRERYSSLDLPVLILTAKYSLLDIQTGFLAGANDYLEKPFESMELECRIRTLIQLKKTKELLLERETAFLQAQIKPHFLFNALNTISSFCYTNSEKASELLLELGLFLRGSFDFKSTTTFVSIEKELRLVKAYVSIQKARYDNRLNVTYQYDLSILKYSILPLTIQPIVENSIRHGIMKKISGGHIHINLTLVNEFIKVEITDDGIGMTQETIDSLLLKNPISNGVGLYNINCRLKNYFNTTLYIISNLNQGTTVSFYIPAQIKRNL
jgi:signal transduction histidine kinase